MFAISFVRALRENKKLEKLPSVRATIGLYERAQSNALLKGHSSVETEDVKEAIISVLAHRIGLKPSAKYVISPEEFIREELEEFAEQYQYPQQQGDGR
jgi:MoxR-like ATPase